MSGPRCESCPVPRESPCRSDAFPAFCEWAAAGHPAGLAHIVRISATKTPSAASSDREVIERRRAGKIRLRLGEKAPDRR